MVKQYTSREIAAHFSQSYRDHGKDPEVIQDFIKILEKRVPALRTGSDRQRYQDVSSLLYCMKDLNGSCRDAGMHAELGKLKETDRSLTRAANRLQEIGEIMTEIRHNYPDEYENSCRGFIAKWRGMEFNQGGKLLGNSEPEAAAGPAPAPKAPSGPSL